MTEKNDNQRTYRRFGISERLKCFFSICCFFLFCSLLFAQANNSVVVWVMPTEGKNLGNTELRWLPDEIHRVLREKITNYSGLTVAEENSDSLASIQERSYNENVSEAVRMGRQLGANYVICSTVTKTNNSYS